MIRLPLFYIVLIVVVAGCTDNSHRDTAVGSVGGDNIRVAVASNFAEPAKAIAEAFEKESGHAVTLAFGSTGKHYAQFRHGLPFEVFLAADIRRPKLLEEEGIAIAGSRFTYAIGKIALWSPDENLVDAEANVLTEGKFKHIALANPKLAPYGAAAQTVLEKRGAWKGIRKRYVLGENIAQTYQFVASGNAQLGFVALSQIQRPGKPIKGSYFVFDPALYEPIAQQAVLLKNSDAARAFLTFLRSDAALEIIKGFGYHMPGAGQ
jgi:molybdate transport system substrate-binding protein